MLNTHTESQNSGNYLYDDVKKYKKRRNAYADADVAAAAREEDCVEMFPDGGAQRRTATGHPVTPIVISSLLFFSMQ